MQNSLCQCFLALEVCLQPASELLQKNWKKKENPSLHFFFILFWSSELIDPLLCHKGHQSNYYREFEATISSALSRLLCSTGKHMSALTYSTFLRLFFIFFARDLTLSRLAKDYGAATVVFTFKFLTHATQGASLCVAVRDLDAQLKHSILSIRACCRSSFHSTSATQRCSALNPLSPPIPPSLHH